MMRVGVIGAGAVGGALAALLSRAGHDVEVTARGEHLRAIRHDGIQLSGAWGDHRARVSASPTLARAAELVVVATKAQDTPAALSANAGVLRGIPVLVVQNGLDGIAHARGIARASDIVGALAMFASSYLSPGKISVTTAGQLYLGGGAGDHDIPTRYIARVLGQVLPVTVVPNFLGAQWTKLVVNQVNALPAITGLSAQQVVAEPRLRRILTASMRETVRVARRKGIRFQSIQGLSARQLCTFALMPLSIGERLPLQLVARMGSVPNPGSTLQSIRRGQATEIDYLNGAVVRAAAGIGLSAPVNSCLVELVHRVEVTRRFLTTDEVAATVPLP